MRKACAMFALLAASLLLSSAAQADNGQGWYEVRRGETPTAVAHKHGLTLDSLEALNPYRDLDARHFYAGQKLNLSSAERDARAWSFLGGDPAGIPLIEQIMLMPVPDAVKQDWRSQIEASQPKSDSLYSPHDHPLYFDGAIFGGRNGSTPKVWGRTVVLLSDPQTLAPVERFAVARFAPFDYEGYRYELYQVERCRNGVFNRTALPVVPVQVAQLPAPCDTVVVEKVVTVHDTLQTPPPVADKEPEERNPNLVNHGNLYLTYEGVRPDQSRDQNNGFSGIELVFPFTRQETVSLDLFASWNVLDQDYTSNYRAGLDVLAYRNTPARIGLKVGGGGWYDAQQRSYRDRNNERIRPYFDGYGAYGRFVAWGPHLFTMEGLYRTGWPDNSPSIVDDKRLTISIEPGMFYAKLGTGIVRTHESSRYLPDTTITFSPVRMTMTETRLGFKPHKRLILSGSWDVWAFRSPVWDFLKKGPGAGVEWRMDDHWKFISTYKRLRTLSHDPVRERAGWSDNRYDEREHRFTASLNYGW